MSGIQSLW